MYDAFNIDSPSPDQRHKALLAFSGEVRFGPSYYRLSVDGSPLGERIFGDAHLWSPGSDLLAVQEWLTLDYSKGPITALVLIDVEHRREARIDQATKRFLVPERFEDRVLVYRETGAGQEIVKHFGLDTLKSMKWKALSRAN